MPDRVTCDQGVLDEIVRYEHGECVLHVEQLDGDLYSVIWYGRDGEVVQFNADNVHGLTVMPGESDA
jgi:hypothetical protein